MGWRTAASIACAGLVALGALTAASASAAPAPVFGKGQRTCVPGPKADCRDIVHRWTAAHHGNLSGANFARAELHGADFRGARLDRANLRGAVLRHAHLHDASLRHANLGPVVARGQGLRSAPACTPN